MTSSFVAFAQVLLFSCSRGRQCGWISWGVFMFEVRTRCRMPFQRFLNFLRIQFFCLTQFSYQFPTVSFLSVGFPVFICWVLRTSCPQWSPYLPTYQSFNVQYPYGQVGRLHVVSTFSAWNLFSILPCC